MRGGPKKTLGHRVWLQIYLNRSNTFAQFLVNLNCGKNCANWFTCLETCAVKLTGDIFGPPCKLMNRIDVVCSFGSSKVGVSRTATRSRLFLGVRVWNHRWNHPALSLRTLSNEFAAHLRNSAARRREQYRRILACADDGVAGSDVTVMLRGRKRYHVLPVRVQLQSRAVLGNRWCCR